VPLLMLGCRTSSTSTSTSTWTSTITGGDPAILDADGRAKITIQP
jgi:hypothetical protein